MKRNPEHTFSEQRDPVKDLSTNERVFLWAIENALKRYKNGWEKNEVRKLYLEEIEGFKKLTKQEREELALPISFKYPSIMDLNVILAFANDYYHGEETDIETFIIDSDFIKLLDKLSDAYDGLKK